MPQIQSLAWERPHAKGVAKKKKSTSNTNYFFVTEKEHRTKLLNEVLLT